MKRIQQVEYASSAWGNQKYSSIQFGDKYYVSLKSNSINKLAELVLDSNDEYTVRPGETLDLGQGYSLDVKQVDVDGEKVWLQFNKEGEYVDDEILSVGTGDSTWDVELDDVQDEDDVVVSKVHIKQVLQGGVDSLVQIDGLWLIDFENAFTVD